MVLTGLTQKRKKRGHLQKLYANMYCSVRTLASKHRLGSASGIVQYRVSEELHFLDPKRAGRFGRVHQMQ